MVDIGFIPSQLPVVIMSWCNGFGQQTVNGVVIKKTQTNADLRQISHGSALGNCYQFGVLAYDTVS